MMEYFKEQDRKFIDKGDLKIYHSVYPVNMPDHDGKWGQVLRFDNKVIVPGGQEIQHFDNGPLLIVRLQINGSTAYYDSTGYRKVLKENDTLVVGYNDAPVQSILYNFDTAQESELLEFWLPQDTEERVRFFKSGKQHSNLSEALVLDFPALNPGSILLQDGQWLWRGSFPKNTDHLIETGGDDDHLILFVLSGAVTANGHKLGFRDGAAIRMEETIDLYFEKDTDLLLIQLNPKAEQLKLG